LLLGCNSMKNEPNNRILTTQQVAEMFQVHRTTIFRLAKSGELKSYKVGSCRRFKESEVWAFFDNQEDRDCVGGKET